MNMFKITILFLAILSLTNSTGLAQDIEVVPVLSGEICCCITIHEKEVCYKTDKGNCPPRFNVKNSSTCPIPVRTGRSSRTRKGFFLPRKNKSPIPVRTGRSSRTTRGR